MQENKTPYTDGNTPAKRSLPGRLGFGAAQAGEGGEEGEASVVRHSPITNWIAFIGALAMAFVIWLFVMGTDSPSFIGDLTEVPIRIENNSGLSILSGDGLTVDLKVEGKRSLIQNVHMEDIDVSVTVEPETSPGRYTYDLNIQLPGGLRLVESSLTRIMVYLDNTTSVSVPVRVKLSEYILQDSYEIGLNDITTSIQTVRVTGPESLLSTIECAQISLALGNITRSVTCIGALTLVDASGDTVSSSYIRMAQNEATVTIPVYQYRTLDLKVQYRHGYFNDENVEIKVEPASVTVRGEADVVNQLSWEYTLDEKAMQGDGVYNVALTLPEGVTNIDGVSSVSISVTHIGTKTKVLPITNFQVLNTGGRTYEMVTKTLNVTLRAEQALLALLTPEDVTAIIDLGSNQYSGDNVTVPVTFRFSGAYSGKVYEVGTYSATIRLTA